jgi:hypothetical protein
VAETWREVRTELVHGSAEHWLILWRRVAGGLSRGQQLAIGEPSLAAIRALYKRVVDGKGRSGESSLNAAASQEMWRLLGSLELLPVPMKIELGSAIVDFLAKPKLHRVLDAMVWTLGRLGQRVPVYGPLNTVVPPETAGAWLQALMDQDRATPVDLLAAMQLGRYTQDRHRDLADEVRGKTAAWIEKNGGASHLVHLVRAGGRLDQEEQSQIVGETLPRGLRLAGGEALPGELKTWP